MTGPRTGACLRACHVERRAGTPATSRRPISNNKNNNNNTTSVFADDAGVGQCGRAGRAGDTMAATVRASAMSALLAQLTHILAPWDAAENVGAAPFPPPRQDNEAGSHSFQPPSSSPSTAVPVSFLTVPQVSPATASSPSPDAPTTAGALDTTALTDARQRNTKLELARAALAVFVSNAGEFRPVLQRTLTFLFQYVDFLLEERGRNVLELAASRHLAHQSREATQSAGGEASGDAAEDDIVASAHQRVRLVEAKMAALVEEASAQRDRYKAQIAAHEQQAARLEALLVHQIELTEMLLHDKQAGTSAGAGGGADGNRARPKADDSLDRARDRAHATTSLWSEETWAQRDRTYVRQLIARAEKEKLVAGLDDEVGALKVDKERAQRQVQDLLGLNARYARQAVELAARMSVIHDQNIALSTDVQLYQRDTVREQQRADKLLRDLTVSRRMLLTLLEVRAQEVQSTMGPLMYWNRTDSPATDGGAVTPALHANTTLLLHAAGAPPSLGAAEDAMLSRMALHADDKRSFSGFGSAAGGGMLGLARAGVWGAAKPLTLDDQDLRAQLGELLTATTRVTIDGVDVAASTRSLADQQHAQQALEKLLLLRQYSNQSAVGTAQRRQQKNDSDEGKLPVAAAGSAAGGAVPSSPLRLPPHLWAAPCGRHRHVPLHLRTTMCTRLLPLHPLVAECYVQELLSQRLDLRLALRRRRQREEEASVAATVMAAAAGAARSVGLRRPKRWSLLAGTGPGRDSHTHPPGTWRMTPFDAYVCLFVRVLWLNEEEVFLPYLPDDVRQLYMLERAPTTVPGAASPHSPRGRRQQGLVDAASRTDAPPHPTEKQRSCLTSPLDAPEELYQLPPEALRLTYSLDILSRSPEAGFLTYAYGWTSRRVLSELIFDVLRAERETFLSMCYAVDAQREVLKASRRAEARRAIRDARRRARREARARQQQEQQQQEAAADRPAPTGDTAKKTKKSKSVASTGSNTKKGTRSGALAKKSVTSAAAPPSGNENTSDDEDEADDVEGVDAPPCAGCLPLVQVARILATMYPSYSLEKLEQLVLAAAADGTSGTERAVMVYYGVLLPDRLLPGSAGAVSRHQTDHATKSRSSAKARSSPSPSRTAEGQEPTASAVLWRCGSFASLFFSHICDDALESMALVEDSLASMAETLHSTTSTHAVPSTSVDAHATTTTATTTAGHDEHTAKKEQSRTEAEGTAQRNGLDSLETERSVPVEAVEATEAQLSALGFTALPLEQMQAWSTALRSVLHHWPRLQVHTTSKDIDPAQFSLNREVASTTSSPGTPGGRPVSPRSLNTADAPAEAAAAPEPVVSPRVSVSEVIAYIRAHILLRRGPHRPSTAQITAANACLPAEAITVVHHSVNQHWCPTHAAYIHALQTRWNAAYGVADKSAESSLPPASAQHTELLATAESIAAEVGAMDSASFLAWLHKLDSRREAVWGDDEVTASNPVLRPADDIDDGDDDEDDAEDGDDGSATGEGTMSSATQGRPSHRMPTPPPEPRGKAVVAPAKSDVQE